MIEYHARAMVRQQGALGVSHKMTITYWVPEDAGTDECRFRAVLAFNKAGYEVAQLLYHGRAIV